MKFGFLVMRFPQQLAYRSLGYAGFHPTRTHPLRYPGLGPAGRRLARWERWGTRGLLGWLGLLGGVLLVPQLPLPGRTQLAVGLLVVLVCTSPLAVLLMLGLLGLDLRDTLLATKHKSTAVPAPPIDWKWGDWTTDRELPAPPVGRIKLR